MMKVLFLTALLVGSFLVGCVSSNILLSSSKTQLKLTMSSPFTNSNDKMYIVKVTPELRKHCGELKQGQYAMWSDSCDFGSNPPSALNLEYILVQAKKDEFKNLSSKQIVDISARYIQSLPPSAWRTYTVNLKPVQDEVNRLYRTDPRGTYKFGAKATITLYIDANGNVSQKVDYDRVTKGWLL